MHKNYFFGMLMVLAIVGSGCQSTNTYSKLREQEKQVIKDYIAREGINVVNELPTVWGEKDYYMVPNTDDFYLHVIDPGNKDAVAEAGQTILMRFKKYGLTAYSDTIRFWTTEDGGEPVHFQLGNTSDEYYCYGWTKAIEVMQYSGGHCRIICPSKMGFTDDNSSVTPYGYELRFSVKKF